jgi:hypothetical protein
MKILRDIRKLKEITSELLEQKVNQKSCTYCGCLIERGQEYTLLIGDKTKPWQDIKSYYCHAHKPPYHYHDINTDKFYVMLNKMVEVDIKGKLKK